MPNIILFDEVDTWTSLLPLTYTRPISELRCGILTISEKWRSIYNKKISYITKDYLAEKFPITITEDNILINSSILPSTKLREAIDDLDLNEALIFDDQMIAARLDKAQFDNLINDETVDEIKGYDLTEQDIQFTQINRPHDLFVNNASEIQNDYDLLTKGRTSQEADSSNRIINKSNVFIEEGASIQCAVINASEGPVYIGKHATIMEGAIIRGPFAMNEHAVVKMGAKIYEATTLGPWCKVGGEVGNVVFQAYSSKAHDGYLGNSVIGEWCNLGADTNSSNLKNNYDEVKVWSYADQRFTKTGLTFHGLIMGDHSKCGINTMFNTGTVIGVNVNIFGSGFPRNFVPSFSWGGYSGFTTYQTNKAFKTAEIVMNRRSKELDDIDQRILQYIFHESAKFRSWE